jgi:hypothetical protein
MYYYIIFFLFFINKFCKFKRQHNNFCVTYYLLKKLNKIFQNYNTVSTFYKFSFNFINELSRSRQVIKYFFVYYSVDKKTE